jgi:hypothetical protein
MAFTTQRPVQEEQEVIRLERRARLPSSTAASARRARGSPGRLEDCPGPRPTSPNGASGGARHVDVPGRVDGRPRERRTGLACDGSRPVDFCSADASNYYTEASANLDNSNGSGSNGQSDRELHLTVISGASNLGGIVDDHLNRCAAIRRVRPARCDEPVAALLRTRSRRMLLHSEI